MSTPTVYRVGTKKAEDKKDDKKDKKKDSKETTAQKSETTTAAQKSTTAAQENYQNLHCRKLCLSNCIQGEMKS